VALPVAALLFVTAARGDLLEDPGFELATGGGQASNSAWVLDVNFPDGVTGAANFQEAPWAARTGDVGLWFRAFEGNQNPGVDPPAAAKIFQDFGAGGVLLESVSLDLNPLSPNDGSWNMYMVSGRAPAGTQTVRAFAEMIGGVDALLNPQSAFLDDMDMTVSGGIYTLTAWHKVEIHYTSDATLIGIEFLGVPEPACGDAVVDPGEECDDGNTVAGDGCSALCEIEVCLGSPVTGCVVAANASLAVVEKKPGDEKLKATLKGFDSETTQGDFGDPVGGTTVYSVCIYDSGGILAAELAVDRAGTLCGPKSKDCWKAKKTKGYTYKDKDASADGMKKIATTSGAAGKGKVTFQAANKSKKSQSDLPTGIAAALSGSGEARLQVATSDARCFEAVLGTVKKNDGVQFKAKAP